VGLQLLERVVHREAGVAVVEPDHEAHRHLVLAHRIDERAAELAVLCSEAKRPAHRVDHAVERLRHLPDLLHAELPLLRVLGAQLEVPDGGAREVALRALGQHGGLADQVRAGFEVAELLALAAAALVAAPHADHVPAVHEQPRRGGLAEDVHAGLLGLLGQPAAELGDRDHVVAVVAEGRGHRLERDRALAVGQQVDGVPVDGAVAGPVVLGQVGEERLHRRRPHHGAREQVRAGALALLDERHRHLAQRLGERLVLGQQLGQPDRTGEARRPAADDHHADLDALLLGVGRLADELLGGVHRRRKLDRRSHSRLSRPSWPSLPR
jgi:hypothetical protein